MIFAFFSSFRAFSESNNSKEKRREGVFIFSDGFAIYETQEAKGEKNSFPPILLRPIDSLKSKGVSASFPSFPQYFRNQLFCRARRPDLLWGEIITAKSEWRKANSKKRMANSQHPNNFLYVQVDLKILLKKLKDALLHFEATRVWDVPQLRL